MYRAEVESVAANVPIGIERWVSFNTEERFEPAIIPVTAGKNKPTNALEKKENIKIIFKKRRSSRKHSLLSVCASLYGKSTRS